MDPKERLEILRRAKPNSWIAFSEDESKFVAAGETYSQVLEAAENAGETAPVVVKVPDTWASTVLLVAPLEIPL